MIYDNYICEDIMQSGYAIIENIVLARDTSSYLSVEDGETHTYMDRVKTKPLVCKVVLRA